MYTKVKNPALTIYDVDTGSLVGMATFELRPVAEKALLDLVNNNTVPYALEITKVDFIPASGLYIPPILYQTTRRKGELRAIFTQAESGEEVPFRINIEYDVRSNSGVGYPYKFDSVVVSKIKVESAQQYY